MRAAMLFPKIGYRKKNSFFNLFIGGALAWLLFQLPVYATIGVKLTWTANSGSKIAGYKIYSGTSSRNYSRTVTVGPAATSVTISGLTEGATYYFAATDFDSAGDQSAYSDEFVYVAGAATLASSVQVANQFSFNVAGITGRKYIVQASTNLLAWSSIKTNTAPFQYVAANSAAYSRRFFRACLAP
jgi:hypothetical protein